MKNETYKQRFIRKFGELFTDNEVVENYEGHNVARMELSDDEHYVYVIWKNGEKKEVNVECDSLSAMVYDICRRAF